MTEEAPARFGSKEFKSNGPISILAADGNRYQLDDATNEYFGEIEKALREFDDKDDKKNNIQQRRDDGEEEELKQRNEAIEILANNALEGADGKEVELMMDARCSRLIERLVAHATDEALVFFLRKACRGWKTYALAMNIFGSRVLESVIRQVSKRLVVDGEGSVHHHHATTKERGIQEVLKFKEMLLEKEDVDDGFENEGRNRNNNSDDGEKNNLPEAGPRSCLDNLSYVLSSRATDISFDQRASPVARRVFFLFAGKDMPLNPGGRDKTLAVGQQNYKPQGNLESKLKGATSAEQFDASKKNREKHRDEKNEDRINAFPELLESHTNDVLANVEEVLWDMTDDPCASAYLQAILLSQEGDDASLKWIIPGLLGCAPPEDAPDGELLADLSSDDMKALMQSRSGSHLLEVIVRVAPRTLGAEIWRRFFRDKLMSISKHPVANFVLQSVLGSSKDPAVVASAVSELSALFGTLLYENRAGVIAALLAACLRLKTNEKDCCKALARGVTFKLEKKNANNATAADGTHNEEGGGGSRKGGKSQLARALLFLGNPPHGRCSVLGAAMMQTLAKYPADATVMFLESLCDTDPKTLLQAARDASGSHAIEAILNSRLVKAKHKKAIAELLVDNAVALAVSSGGSRVLEACYRETDNKTKKKIVELCSKREKEIVATRHGVVLFKRLGVKQFQNNASGWEKREEKSAAIRAEFEKEFGFDAPEKEKEENRNKTVLREVPPPPQKRKSRDEIHPGGEDERENDDENDDTIGDKKKSKKEKKEKKEKKKKTTEKSLEEELEERMRKAAESARAEAQARIAMNNGFQDTASVYAAPTSVKKGKKSSTVQPDYNELFPSGGGGGGGYGNGMSSSKQYDGFGSQPYYPAPAQGVSLNTAVAKANEAANKAKGWLSGKLAGWSDSLNGQQGIDQRPGSGATNTTNSANPGQSFQHHPPAPSGWGGGPINSGQPDLRKYGNHQTDDRFWNDVAPEKVKSKKKKSKSKKTEDEFANSVNGLADAFGGQANIDDWYD